MKFTRNLLISAVACLIGVVGAVATIASPVYEPGTDRVTAFTNVTASVPASSTTTILTNASRHVVIETSAAAAILYVRLDSTTATTANFAIAPGTQINLEALPLVSSVTVIGASATGTYSILAW